MTDTSECLSFFFFFFKMVRTDVRGKVCEGHVFISLWGLDKIFFFFFTLVEENVFIKVEISTFGD